MWKPSISILFLCFIILTNTPPSHSNNQTDFEALLTFKNSINNDTLGALSSWNETTHFCSWSGVSCSKRHPNRVVSLSLRSQGLVGSLPPHIGNLSFLRAIILQNNTFRGPIPQEIGRLRRLEMIEFSNNSFGGGIPTNLSNCINLYYLNLMDNELTGAIVPEIGSLLKLQRLGLSNNMFSDTIPPFLGNLTNLIELDVAQCGMQGQIPESLAQLKIIRNLRLFGNNLTGLVPSSLFNLSSIEAFSISFNRLHGSIPSSEVFNLPKLRFLSLGSNDFTGELPSSLSNSSLIGAFQIYSNSFTGNMIDLTRFSSLQILSASDNYLKGDMHTILSSLTNSTALRVVQLQRNHFTGSMPDSIGNLSTLLYNFLIGQNQLSGSIPPSIGGLVGLSVFGADANDLQGPIPSSIGKLEKLQEIYLHENRLTDEMPQSFGNLTLLNYLRLGRNDLFGSIPQSLGNCTNLQALDLSDNRFNGSIPTEVLRLSSISIGLDLSGNVLTGSIPSEVGSLRNLGFLIMSDNRLSGKIPTSLSNCVMLNRLLMNGNSLQGEIPDGLRALRGLDYFDLSQNNLSGVIPRFLVEFHLLYLNLSFNAFQGEVPTSGVFLNETAISLQGNRGLCGGITGLNLPSCRSTSTDNKDLGKILIPVVAGAICIALVMCFCVIMWRRRMSKKAGPPAPTLVGSDFLRLSYAQLLTATDGFSESNLLGSGRFGSVYKATIFNDDDNEERVVAVKVLNLNIRGAYKSLAAECNALRGIRHRNLLKITSVCDSIDSQGNDFKALVYEYMANGSLEDWLHRNSEEQGRVLSTIQRLDIAIDIASAVEYLHCGTNTTVVHGDLKPSNILMDLDMVAHVGDFGLAKIISSISQNLSSREESNTVAIKGTIGYIAPEYGMNDVVSTQGDAYSYGILLLEMFTNKRPTSDDAFEGYTNLQDFVSGALPDRVKEVVDLHLHEEVDKGDKYWDCLVSILRIGVRCSKELPRDRMPMGEVVVDLRKIRSVLVVERNVAL